MKCQTADLTADRIKSRDDNALGGVVDDDLHAGGCFKGTDVATFTTDDAPLDLVVVDMEDTHGVFDGRLGGYTLYCLDDDLLCLHVGIEP